MVNSLQMNDVRLLVPMIIRFFSVNKVRNFGVYFLRLRWTNVRAITARDTDSIIYDDTFKS